MSVTLPTVGGSTNTWGTTVNNALSGLDGRVTTLESSGGGGGSGTVSGPWTSYTPTTTNLTSGSAIGHYRIDGKTCFLVVLANGTTNGSVPQISLPSGVTSVAASGIEFPLAGSQPTIVVPVIPNNSTAVFLYGAVGPVAAPSSGVSLNVYVSGVFETA